MKSNWKKALAVVMAFLMVVVSCREIWQEVQCMRLLILVEPMGR